MMVTAGVLSDNLVSTTKHILSHNFISWNLQSGWWLFFFGKTFFFQIKEAIQFLHELGTVQYFDNDFLREIIVINPQWIVNVMACVVSVKDSQLQVNKEFFLYLILYYSCLRYLVQHCFMCVKIISLSWVQRHGNMKTLSTHHSQFCCKSKGRRNIKCSVLSMASNALSYHRKFPGCCWAKGVNNSASEKHKV